MSSSPVNTLEWNQSDQTIINVPTFDELYYRLFMCDVGSTPPELYTRIFEQFILGTDLTIALSRVPNNSMPVLVVNETNKYLHPNVDYTINAAAISLNTNNSLVAAGSVVNCVYWV